MEEQFRPRLFECAFRQRFSLGETVVWAIETNSSLFFQTTKSPFISLGFLASNSILGNASLDTLPEPIPPFVATDNPSEETSLAAVIIGAVIGVNFLAAGLISLFLWWRQGRTALEQPSSSCAQVEFVPDTFESGTTTASDTTSYEIGRGALNAPLLFRVVDEH
jgi:hypothetical protein